MEQDERDEILRSLTRTIEHQRSINDDLRQVIVNHESRLVYAEETLRLIKDILERLNGR